MQPRQSLFVQVRDHLVAEVVTGRLHPGARIRELDLARQLGVSQGTVREALRALVAFGLVDTAPNRGTRIRDLDENTLEATYPVRAALESLAGQLAAPHLEGATEFLATSLRGMRHGASMGVVAEVAQHSIAFHSCIVDAAKNPALRNAWRSLGIEILTSITLSRTDVNLSIAAEEHLPILQALDQGDGATASSLLAHHASDYGIRLGL